MSKVHQVRKRFILEGEVRHEQDTVDLSHLPEPFYQEILARKLVYTSELADSEVVEKPQPKAPKQMFAVSETGDSLELTEAELESHKPPKAAIPVDLPPSPKRKKE